MNGTAVNDERFVIVEVHSGNIKLKTGRISRTNSSPGQGGNAWADLRFHPTKEGPNDIYQRSLRVDNIHLLKEHEAQLLQDPAAAQNWFGAIYQDRVVTKIARALKRLKRA